MRFAGPVAIAFPLVIVLFVPLRLRLLPKVFSAAELAGLSFEGCFVFRRAVNESVGCANSWHRVCCIAFVAPGVTADAGIFTPALTGKRTALDR
jgi:hypothetical protein